MSETDLVPTPSQTIGPFYHFALTADARQASLAGETARGERCRLVCRVFDGEGAPVDDAMIELWQADAGGNYNPDPVFRGFGRLATDQAGACEFETVKPGRVPAPGGGLQAPHVSVSIFARGLLERLATRIYFSGDAANAEDPVLALVPEHRRATLLAHLDARRPGAWIFEIRLSGDRETVFFEV